MRNEPKVFVNRNRELLVAVEMALLLADELGADMVGIHLDTARVALIDAIGSDAEKQAETVFPTLVS